LQSSSTARSIAPAVRTTVSRPGTFGSLLGGV
jgi:hypothetical protein